MIKKYKVSFPFAPDMGSISPMIVNDYPMETKEENALWHLNSMRDHDGLPHRKSLSKGTKFVEIFN